MFLCQNAHIVFLEQVMARTKAVLGAGARLSDYLSASLLARVYPATMIGGILDEHGCNSKRIRSLPAVPGTYFCKSRGQVLTQR